MGQGMTWSLIQIIYLFAFTIFSVHGTIFVISEETNETVRVIYEKNIRAVSDAVEVSSIQTKFDEFEFGNNLILILKLLVCHFKGICRDF